MNTNYQRGKIKNRQEDTKKTILVIDNEFDIINAIKIWLERHNFAVCAFTGPLLASEHFKNILNKISLVLSDIIMPRMNGYELVSKIKVTTQGQGYLNVSI